MLTSRLAKPGGVLKAAEGSVLKYYTGISKTPKPSRMMSEVAKELNVAWATNGGRRLLVRSKSAHRTIARMKSAGSRTGSRCSNEKRTEEASAARAKEVLLAARGEPSGTPRLVDR